MSDKSETPDQLDPQHQLFVDKYFELTFNQTKAAIAAGYSKKSARNQAYRLMKNDDIRAAIDVRMAELTMGKNEVLARLADHARGDMREFISQSPRALSRHPNGNLIRKFKRTITTDKDGNKDEKIELELYDAQAALVQLGKHLGLFSDKLDLTSGGEPIKPVVFLPQVSDDSDT